MVNLDFEVFSVLLENFQVFIDVIEIQDLCGEFATHKLVYTL